MSEESEIFTYFAYLDVLGYKNFLKSDLKSSEMRFKDKLLVAFHVFDDVNNTVYQYKAVSDSIFLKCTNREKFIGFLELIKKIYIAFIKQGLFLRGGLAYGKHFENDRITYSHVLTKAHDLANSLAEYPRVVIDENIILMLEDQKIDILNSKLVLKSGNIYFLNIIDSSNWLDIFESAQFMYNNDKDQIDGDERARMKHIWFQNYLIEMKPEELENKEKYIEIFSLW